jgi:SpoVK/Ycf46/Vps4 family AAA+-type ATPase
LPETAENEWREDRYGFLRWLVLPTSGWREWWDRIYVDPETKQRLHSYASFSLRHRAEFSRVGLPVHGIALLYGPPGTGKSSLARGLAQIVAEDFLADGTAEQLIFAEVDPHALPSQMLGESQRNTVNLLEKSLPELAAKGHPVIVVIDEVNSLAMRRSIAAGGRDPVDVMRATEAVLRGVDYLASTTPNVLIVATSNFTATIDEALLDRIDIAVEIGLPDRDRVVEILEDTFTELPAVEISSAEVGRIAASLVGRSGRDIRKVVLDAIVTRSQDPTKPLLATDLQRTLDLNQQRITL